MAIGAKNVLSDEVQERLKNPRIKVIKLLCIDKWYHAGLACQTLGVFAIPAELEK